jgi:hypothetical protein
MKQKAASSQTRLAYSLFTTIYSPTQSNFSVTIASLTSPIAFVI